MSQPETFGPANKDPLATHLKDIHQLIDLFKRAEKPESLMGIEYELFAWDLIANAPLKYEGERSITQFFLTFSKKNTQSNEPFEPIFEENNIVGLNSKRAIIALEPGGQVEIALKPKNSLNDLITDLSQLVHELNECAKELKIALFACGLHPLAKQNEMAFVKKQRYTIMRQYMKKLGGRGLDMMTRSCAIQLNLDFKNEKDMVNKTRLAACLSPFYALLFSSSAFLEGKKTDHPTERSYIWQQTDKDRTGIPHVIFEKDFSYKRYIEWVLDVPMYFIRRNSHYIDVSGASFKDYMKHGYKDIKPTVRDFVDHMSTVFSEVRLKPILEIRSPDSLPLAYTNAICALTWTLFYCPKAYQKVQELFKNVSYEKIKTLQYDIISYGKNAEYENKNVYLWLLDILNIAHESLITNDMLHYLNPLKSLIEKKITYDEWLKKNFDSINKKNFNNYLDIFSAFASPLV